MYFFAVFTLWRPLASSVVDRWLPYNGHTMSGTLGVNVHTGRVRGESYAKI